MNATTEDRDHRWFRDHVIGHALGLLEDADQERFDRLRRESEACREQWQEFAGDASTEDPSAGHLPASLLGRWPRAQLRLRGLERELVGSHLEACTACRAELELLGFEPTLVPAGAEGNPAATGPTSRGSWFDLRSLVTGALVGATAAAAAVGFLISGPRDVADLPATLPWVAPTSLRGDDLPLLATGADQPAITLMVEIPLDFSVDRPVQLTVADPEGREILRDSIATERVSAQLLMVVLPRGEGWSAGRYTVRLTQTEGASTRESESVFRLEPR